MKLQKSLRALVVGAALLISGGAVAGGFVCLIDQALEAKAPVDIKTHGKTFVMSPVTTTEGLEKGTMLVSGTISHLDAGKKHSVVYHITRKDGVVTDISLKVNDGAAQSLSPGLMKAMGDYYGKTMVPSKKLHDVLSTLANTADRTSWQQAAEFLVASVALRQLC